MAHAHDPRRAAAFRDAGDQDAQDRGKRMACDRLEKLDAEGGADADHDLAGIMRRRRRPDRTVGNARDLAGTESRLASEHFFPREHVANSDDLFATRGTHAVTGAMAEVFIRIVDCADDLAVA